MRSHSAQVRRAPPGAFAVNKKPELFHEVIDAHLACIIRFDLKSELVTNAIDETALARAQVMDGKLMLVTNVRDRADSELVQRYKAQASEQGVPQRCRAGLLRCASSSG